MFASHDLTLRKIPPRTLPSSVLQNIVRLSSCCYRCLLYSFFLFFIVFCFNQPSIRSIPSLPLYLLAPLSLILPCCMCMCAIVTSVARTRLIMHFSPGYFVTNFTLHFCFLFIFFGISSRPTPSFPSFLESFCDDSDDHPPLGWSSLPVGSSVVPPYAFPQRPN